MNLSILQSRPDSLIPQHSISSGQSSMNVQQQYLLNPVAVSSVQSMEGGVVIGTTPNGMHRQIRPSPAAQSQGIALLDGSSFSTLPTAVEVLPTAVPVGNGPGQYFVVLPQQDSLTPKVTNAAISDDKLLSTSQSSLAAILQASSQLNPSASAAIASLGQTAFLPLTRFELGSGAPKVAIMAAGAGRNGESKGPPSPAPRKVAHNEVEKRRRDKINNWIMEIADMLPPSEMEDANRQSKGAILSKAVDYIKKLRSTNAQLIEQFQAEMQALHDKISKLQSDNTAYRERLRHETVPAVNEVDHPIISPVDRPTISLPMMVIKSEFLPASRHSPGLDGNVANNIICSPPRVSISEESLSATDIDTDPGEISHHQNDDSRYFLHKHTSPPMSDVARVIQSVLQPLPAHSTAPVPLHIKKSNHLLLQPQSLDHSGLAPVGPSPGGRHTDLATEDSCISTNNYCTFDYLLSVAPDKQPRKRLLASRSMSSPGNDASSPTETPNFSRRFSQPLNEAASCSLPVVPFTSPKQLSPGLIQNTPNTNSLPCSLPVVTSHRTSGNLSSSPPCSSANDNYSRINVINTLASRSLLSPSSAIDSFIDLIHRGSISAAAASSIISRENTTISPRVDLRVPFGESHLRCSETSTDNLSTIGHRDSSILSPSGQLIDANCGRCDSMVSTTMFSSTVPYFAASKAIEDYGDYLKSVHSSNASVENLVASNRIIFGKNESSFVDQPNDEETTRDATDIFESFNSDHLPSDRASCIFQDTGSKNAVQFVVFDKNESLPLNSTDPVSVERSSLKRIWSDDNNDGEHRQRRQLLQLMLQEQSEGGDDRAGLRMDLIKKSRLSSPTSTIG